MPKVLSRAWENLFEIQHAQPEDTHELFHNLLEDLQIIKLEYSLSMGDEHLSTIPETESDEVIKSSVKNLVQSQVSLSDDKSLSNEDVPMEIFKIYSNPFIDDEESISTKIDLHYFNAEYNLLESLFNRDTLIDSSSNFDFLLEVFSGDLAHIDLISPGIKEFDFDLEEEIRLVENLLYDNSSPQPPEELNAEIVDTFIESLFPSPIPVEDRDIHFLKEFLSNDTLPLPKNVSSNFDHHDDPSFPRPPPEPPDVETLCLNIDTLLSFSSENEDKVFKPEIPYGEIKVHIEVLSVLWGNRLPILDSSLPVSRLLKDHSLLKGQGSPDRNKTPGPWSARILMWQLFKGLGGCSSLFYLKGLIAETRHKKRERTKIAMRNREPNETVFVLYVYVFSCFKDPKARYKLEMIKSIRAQRAASDPKIISADMAHGVHPNFMDKHEEHRCPELHKGLVIKHNANQHYATSGIIDFHFKEIAKIHNLPTHDFVVRNDMGCGSTIGPILASGIGIWIVDCGIPQLLMHSAR
nr:probable aspartyl aminopeptidase [Tanacetum cinerariifolium]